MNIIRRLRDRQNSYKEAPVTIAFLGDSVTQGCFENYTIEDKWVETVYDNASSYSSRLKEILQLLFPHTQVNIINSGISGDNTVGGLSRVDRDVLSYHPDLVVVSYGLNDASNGKDGLQSYKNNLKEIFTKLQQGGCEVIFVTQNHMARLVSCFLKDPLLQNLAKEFSSWQNSGIVTEYFESAKQVCADCGVKVCDMYSAWEKMLNVAEINTTELLANKLNHPIREWHLYMAIKLVEMFFED